MGKMSYKVYCFHWLWKVWPRVYLDIIRGTKMILDQKSLKNLDIVSTNGQASLFSVLDKTSTAMGKRLLFTWWEICTFEFKIFWLSFFLFRVCMPLLSVKEIEDRQLALRYLHNRPKLVEDIRNALKGIPDIEKLLSAIHSAGKTWSKKASSKVIWQISGNKITGVKLSSGHPESRAVYYEQASVAKAKISRLVNCLEGLNAIDSLVTGTNFKGKDKTQS